MENIQKPKGGAAIKTLSIIRLVISGFGIMAIITTFLMKDAIKKAGVSEIPTYTVIISLIISLLVIIGIILILIKKELGIYIYFIGEVANIVSSIVSNGFKPWTLIMFIIPVFMCVFIWKNKEIFNIKVTT